MSTSINIDVNLKGSIGISVSKHYRMSQYHCSHPDKIQILCKGLSIVLTTAFHTSIGTHVCKGRGIVLIDYDRRGGRIKSSVPLAPLASLAPLAPLAPLV